MKVKFKHFEIYFYDIKKYFKDKYEIINDFNQ